MQLQQALKRPILLLFLFFCTLPVTIFASGDAEVDPLSLVPDPIVLPEDFPTALGSPGELRQVLGFFDDHLAVMEALIESLMVNGLAPNQAVVDSLIEAVAWWKMYIPAMTIRANNPDLTRDAVNNFFEGLLSRDEQFSTYLATINQLIEP